ncbi:MAG: NnrU family protein [Ramlibacter sp.]|nr:NnrU family protein [Ramlibacter sp.]
MAMLVLGLVLFLGIHSTRMFADHWRTGMIARMGALPWKALFAGISLAGFVVIVWGFRLARQETLVLYSPPAWMHHATALLMVISFILLAAAYIPRNSIKARLHHPMVLGVKLWAVGHLLSNGELVNVLLFGAFLAWAVLNFRSARRRDRAEGTVYRPGHVIGTAVAVVTGLVAWSVFALLLHGPLIGVRPLGY